MQKHTNKRKTDTRTGKTAAKRKQQVEDEKNSSKAEKSENSYEPYAAHMLIVLIKVDHNKSGQ